MLVFEERGKPEYPEKNLSEKSCEPTNKGSGLFYSSKADRWVRMLIYQIWPKVFIISS